MTLNLEEDNIKVFTFGDVRDILKEVLPIGQVSLSTSLLAMRSLVALSTALASPSPPARHLTTASTPTRRSRDPSSSCVNHRGRHEQHHRPPGRTAGRDVRPSEVLLRNLLRSTPRFCFLPAVIIRQPLHLSGRPSALVPQQLKPVQQCPSS